jgi:hypothetical protein
MLSFLLSKNILLKMYLFKLLIFYVAIHDTFIQVIRYSCLLCGEVLLWMKLCFSRCFCFIMMPARCFGCHDYLMSPRVGNPQPAAQPLREILNDWVIKQPDMRQTPHSRKGH